MKPGVCFAAFLFAIFPFSAQAQSLSEIRKVDFRNFSYPFEPPAGREPFKALGNIIRVQKGKAYAEKFGDNVAYFYFIIAEVIYGDLTNDGQEEAAVVSIYGNNAGTFYLTNIYIYAMKEGKPALLSTLSEKEVERDYIERHQAGEYLFETIEGGTRISGGALTVQHFADGAHCCPKHVVTLRVSGMERD